MLRIRERNTEKYGEQENVAGDSDWPRPNTSAHATDGGGEPKEITKNFAPQDGVTEDG
jgi:hypothetical protein